MGFPGGSEVKNLPAIQGTWIRSLGWEDALANQVATRSSIPAPGNPMDRGAWLQYLGSPRVGHDLVTQPSPPPLNKDQGRGKKKKKKYNPLSSGGAEKCPGLTV